MSHAEGVPQDECVESWCAGKDWCAITCTMAVIGRKWNPVIVHRLLEDGPLRFSELSEGLGPITNKVLSDSLEDLQDSNVVERRVSDKQPVEDHYVLDRTWPIARARHRVAGGVGLRAPEGRERERGIGRVVRAWPQSVEPSEPNRPRRYP